MLVWAASARHMGVYNIFERLSREAGDNDFDRNTLPLGPEAYTVVRVIAESTSGSNGIGRK